MNNKGQMIVMNLMLLLIVVVVFMAFIPVFQETISNARGSDGLNCVSTFSNCTAGDPEPCYDESIDSQTTSCLILDIYLPYIIIVVLLMGVAGLMAGRSSMFGMGQQSQPQYAPQY